MAECVANGCCNRPSKDLEFFNFPENDDQRDKWIAALQKPDGWFPSTEAKICSVHFVTRQVSPHPWHPDYIPSVFRRLRTKKRDKSSRARQIIEAELGLDDRTSDGYGEVRKYKKAAAQRAAEDGLGTTSSTQIGEKFVLKRKKPIDSSFLSDTKKKSKQLVDGSDVEFIEEDLESVQSVAFDSYDDNDSLLLEGVAESARVGDTKPKKGTAVRGRPKKGTKRVSGLLLPKTLPNESYFSSEGAPLLTLGEDTVKCDNCQSYIQEIAALNEELLTKRAIVAEWDTIIGDKCKLYQSEIDLYKNELKTLQSKIAGLQMTEDFFKKKKHRVMMYTGLPNYSMLITVFNLVQGAVRKDKHIYKIKPFQKFILSLMRLRMNLKFKDLAHRFNVDLAKIERFFPEWIDALHEQLCHVLLWPHDNVDYRLNSYSVSLKEHYKAVKGTVPVTKFISHNGLVRKNHKIETVCASLLHISQIAQSDVQDKLPDVLANREEITVSYLKFIGKYVSPPPPPPSLPETGGELPIKDDASKPTETSSSGHKSLTDDKSLIDCDKLLTTKKLLTDGNAPPSDSSTLSATEGNLPNFDDGVALAEQISNSEQSNGAGTNQSDIKEDLSEIKNSSHFTASATTSSEDGESTKASVHEPMETDSKVNEPDVIPRGVHDPLGLDQDFATESIPAEKPDPVDIIKNEPAILDWVTSDNSVLDQLEVVQRAVQPNSDTANISNPEKGSDTSFTVDPEKGSGNSSTANPERGSDATSTVVSEKGSDVSSTALEDVKVVTANENVSMQSITATIDSSAVSCSTICGDDVAKASEEETGLGNIKEMLGDQFPSSVSTLPETVGQQGNDSKTASGFPLLNNLTSSSSLVTTSAASTVSEEAMEINNLLETNLGHSVITCAPDENCAVAGGHSAMAGEAFECRAVCSSDPIPVVSSSILTHPMHDVPTSTISSMDMSVSSFLNTLTATVPSSISSGTMSSSQVLPAGLSLASSSVSVAATSGLASTVTSMSQDDLVFNATDVPSVAADILSELMGAANSPVDAANSAAVADQLLSVANALAANAGHLPSHVMPLHTEAGDEAAAMCDVTADSMDTGTSSIAPPPEEQVNADHALSASNLERLHLECQSVHEELIDHVELLAGQLVYNTKLMLFDQFQELVRLGADEADVTPTVTKDVPLALQCWITLTKLKLNLDDQDLAFSYNISAENVHNIFSDWVKIFARQVSSTNRSDSWLDDELLIKQFAYLRSKENKSVEPILEVCRFIDLKSKQKAVPASAIDVVYSSSFSDVWGSVGPQQSASQLQERLNNELQELQGVLQQRPQLSEELLQHSSDEFVRYYTGFADFDSLHDICLALLPGPELSASKRGELSPFSQLMCVLLRLVHNLSKEEILLRIVRPPDSDDAMELLCGDMPQPELDGLLCAWLPWIHSRLLLFVTWPECHDEGRQFVQDLRQRYAYLRSVAPHLRLQAEAVCTALHNAGHHLYCITSEEEEDWADQDELVDWLF